MGGRTHRLYVNTGSEQGIERQTLRKVSIRLLPFLILLYVIAYLDRVNFGFAALEMNSALGLSSEVFGFLSGIFFIGYLLFELPSNLILQKVGARIWIARILISWGIVVIVTAFATDALQVAVLRFVARGRRGRVLPGHLLYLTYWFRGAGTGKGSRSPHDRASISMIIGAPVSTWILDSVHWFGMAGWRWLFILEGVPAVILGCVTYWYFRPAGERRLAHTGGTGLAGRSRSNKRTNSGRNRGTIPAFVR